MILSKAVTSNTRKPGGIDVEEAVKMGPTSKIRL
jgi:hypothetical protein